jgi:hypothetical protein
LKLLQSLQLQLISMLPLLSLPMHMPTFMQPLLTCTLHPLLPHFSPHLPMPTMQLQLPITPITLLFWLLHHSPMDILLMLPFLDTTITRL